MKSILWSGINNNIAIMDSTYANGSGCYTDLYSHHSTGGFCTQISSNSASGGLCVSTHRK
jgi:hypothetical protein